MDPISRRVLPIAAAILAALAISPIAGAQTYPGRSVRAIVPFAPGGATDIIARLVLQKLSEQLGQQFYVEHIPGASGNIGVGQAAKASPDGYTLLFAFSSFVTNPFIFEKVPYNPHKDFDPVTLAVTSPAVLSVNPSLPAHSVHELVALVRAQPGKYSFASGGTGTQPHLAGEQFRLALGLDLVHVPYNGGGPALASMIAGHTPIGFSTLSPAVPHIAEGKLRALAVTGKKRMAILPQVQTMAEAGLREIEGDTWVGILVPAGTAAPVVMTLYREILKVLKLPLISQRLESLGYEIVGSTPEEYGAQIVSELVKWPQIIRAAGVKTQ